jgi:hypothetical protein
MHPAPSLHFVQMKAAGLAKLETSCAVPPRPPSTRLSAQSTEDGWSPWTIQRVQHMPQAEKGGKYHWKPSTLGNGASINNHTKCDQARPACGQCLKAGVECAGYDRPRIFVNATGPGAGNGRTMVPAVPSRGGRDPTAIPSVTMSDGLTRLAYEVRYLELFWDTYLPLNKDLNQQMTYVNPSWVDAANELYPSDGALRAALLALGLATLGRRDGQQWMMEEGLSGYVRSLRQMSEQLRKPYGWKSDALLAASKALGLYEV